MKIRWNAGAVRLRISPSELDALQHGGRVSEVLRLGEHAWASELRANGETVLLIENKGDRATLHFTLSPPDLARLLLPNSEGVYFSTLDGVRFYVEKDFPCAHPRAIEAFEQSETFSAPPDFTARKNPIDELH